MGYLMLGGNLRVFGPSQQPIALGAALVVILPFAVYFARVSGRRWWLAAVLLLLGAFASGSRTAIVMLAVEGIVFLCLKPAETMKLWPALIPALAVVHFAVPGTIGSLKDAFFPKGGLIAQQSKFEAELQPTACGRAYPIAQTNAKRSQSEACLRRGLRNENHWFRLARSKCSDSRRSVAEQCARRRVRRSRCLGLVDGKSLRESCLRASRTGKGGTRRLVVCRAWRLRCELRRRHAYVRRVQLYTSHLHLLDCARFVGRAPQDFDDAAGVKRAGI